MDWEIKDMRKEQGIINAYIDNEAKRLNWDFALGSPFELCAVFPWDGKMTLEDYQKKGMRPSLYHRRLKTYKSIAYEDSPQGYILYPASLNQGKNLLYIGSQACHVASQQEPESRTIVIECLPKTSIFGRHSPRRFKLEIKQAKLYYRIAGNSELTDVVYEADTNRGFCILLEQGGDIQFFYDRSCMNEIRPVEQRI